MSANGHNWRINFYIIHDPKKNQINFGLTTGELLKQPDLHNLHHPSEFFEGTFEKLPFNFMKGRHILFRDRMAGTF